MTTSPFFLNQFKNYNILVILKRTQSIFIISEDSCKGALYVVIQYIFIITCSNLIVLVEISLNGVLIILHFLLLFILIIYLLAWLPLSLWLPLQVVAIRIVDIHILNVIWCLEVRIVDIRSHFTDFNLVYVDLRYLRCWSVWHKLCTWTRSVVLLCNWLWFPLFHWSEV